MPNEASQLGVESRSKTLLNSSEPRLLGTSLTSPVTAQGAFVIGSRGASEDFASSASRSQSTAVDQPPATSRCNGERTTWTRPSEHWT